MSLKIIIPIIVFFFSGLMILGTFIYTQEREYFIGNILPELFGFFLEGFFFVGLFTLFTFLQESKEKKRMKERIKIHLYSADGKKSLSLPIFISRSDLTRTELIGSIAMMPLKAGDMVRYKMDYLRDPILLYEIKDIKESKYRDTLNIKCSEEEINQFDLEKIAKIYDEDKLMNKNINS